MNNEQELKRLAMNIVNQLFDLADVPVEKRQAINDESDVFVQRLLQQHSVTGSGDLVSREEILKRINSSREYYRGLERFDYDAGLDKARYIVSSMNRSPFRHFL